MSVEIGYFFNYPQNLISTANEINVCIGCDLVPYQSDAQDWFSRFLGMELSLGTTEYLENDRELDFENFSYTLNLRTSWAASELRPLQLPAVASIVFALHQSYGIAGMLVYDLQILLARYESRVHSKRGQTLHDVLCDAPFVGFGSHLKRLEARMPQDWGFYSDV